MIDIHTHILAGMDDGAVDYPETLSMLDLARQDGITAMVATPHSNLRYCFDSDQCRREVARLRLDCPAGPVVHTGCEVHLTPENLEAAILHPERFSINGRNCLLLELPLGALPSALESPVQRLLGAGLRPVIAHPERERLFQQDTAYAAYLASLGVYFQVTARAIVDAQPAAVALLKHGLVHCVASDAHGARRRRPHLSTAYEMVARQFDRSTADLLFTENPAACLAGQPLAAARPRRSFFSLFKRPRTSSCPRDSNNAPGPLAQPLPLPAGNLKAAT